jgi:hypothetical protein
MKLAPVPENNDEVFMLNAHVGRVVIEENTAPPVFDSYVNNTWQVENVYDPIAEGWIHDMLMAWDTDTKRWVQVAP